MDINVVLYLGRRNIIQNRYIEASKFDIHAPFDVPDKYYMVFPFVETGIPAGLVRYSNAFIL